MVAKPEIGWYPAHPENVEPRPAAVVYEAVVIHTTDGGRTVADLGRWFGGENVRQGMRGSTHFGVDLDGSIGQYVSLGMMAVAHGQENPTARVAIENGSVSANAWAIGIEHLDGGTPGTVTPVQLEASARLAAWLWVTEIGPHAAMTGAVLDRSRVLGHYELQPRLRAFCPSWPEARFEWYIARVRELVGGDAGGVPPPAPGPTMADVKVGLVTKVIAEDWRALRDDAGKLAG